MYIYYMPILLQLSTKRINNYKPFIIGGVSYMRNFGSNEEYFGDNRDNVFRMKSNMFNWEAGIGIDFYFRYVKFSPVIKGTFGINNLIVPDNSPTPWTDPISKMYYRNISISFIFSG